MIGKDDVLKSFQSALESQGLAEDRKILQMAQAFSPILARQVQAQENIKIPNLSFALADMDFADPDPVLSRVDGKTLWNTENFSEDVLREIGLSDFRAQAIPKDFLHILQRALKNLEEENTQAFDSIMDWITNIVFLRRAELVAGEMSLAEGVSVRRETIDSLSMLSVAGENQPVESAFGIGCFFQCPFIAFIGAGFFQNLNQRAIQEQLYLVSLRLQFYQTLILLKLPLDTATEKYLRYFLLRRGCQQDFPLKISNVKNFDLNMSGAASDSGESDSAAGEIKNLREEICSHLASRPEAEQTLWRQVNDWS